MWLQNVFLFYIWIPEHVFRALIVEELAINISIKYIMNVISKAAALAHTPLFSFSPFNVVRSGVCMLLWPYFVLLTPTILLSHENELQLVMVILCQLVCQTLIRKVGTLFTLESLWLSLSSSLLKGPREKAASKGIRLCNNRQH